MVAGGVRWLLYSRVRDADLASRSRLRFAGALGFLLSDAEPLVLTSCCSIRHPMLRLCLGFPTLALLLVTFGSHEACAQDTTLTTSKEQSTIRTWLGWETGLTVSGHATGTLSLNHVRSSHLFSTRYTRTLGERGEGFAGDIRSEFGILYGRSATWRWGHASLESGIAVVWGQTPLSGSVTRTTVGVPVQATVYLTIPYRPVDWIGFQLGGHTNVNPERSFAGVTVGFVIGKLR